MAIKLWFSSVLLVSGEGHQCGIRCATFLHAIKVTCKRFLCCRGCAHGLSRTTFGHMLCRLNSAALVDLASHIRPFDWSSSFCALLPGMPVCAAFIWERLIWHLRSRPITHSASVKMFTIAQARDHVSCSEVCTFICGVGHVMFFRKLLADDDVRYIPWQWLAYASACTLNGWVWCHLFTR